MSAGVTPVDFVDSLKLDCIVFSIFRLTDTEIAA